MEGSAQEQTLSYKCDGHTWRAQLETGVGQVRFLRMMTSHDLAIACTLPIAGCG